jgi:hypothetical protein
LIEFVVSENGMISKMEVLNKKELHARLAEEAVSVIHDSPRWIPAMICGEKIACVIRQPVVFKVTN